MRIANPMYDAAFKYLMDDQAAARPLVGAVQGEEVVSLQPLPQERSGERLRVLWRARTRASRTR